MSRPLPIRKTGLQHRPRRNPAIGGARFAVDVARDMRPRKPRAHGWRRGCADSGRTIHRPAEPWTRSSDRTATSPMTSAHSPRPRSASGHPGRASTDPSARVGRRIRFAVLVRACDRLYSVHRVHLRTDRVCGPVTVVIEMAATLSASARRPPTVAVTASPVPEHLGRVGMAGTRRASAPHRPPRGRTSG